MHPGDIPRFRSTYGIHDNKTASAQDGFYVTFSLCVTLRCFVVRRFVLCYGGVVYGSPWEDSDGHGEATPSALLLTPSGFRFFHCLPCMAQPPLPLPPAHTTSRDVRHPSFKIYDRFHHRSPLRFRFWRELCRAPASSPPFDQRTTRRLPPDSGVPSF